MVHEIKQNRTIERASILKTVAGLSLALTLTGCLSAQTAQMAPAQDNGSIGVLNVADAAIAGNDPQMALQVSQSVLASDPHDVQALYHEGAAYYAMNRCEDVIAAYQQAG